MLAQGLQQHRKDPYLRPGCEEEVVSGQWAYVVGVTVPLNSLETQELGVSEPLEKVISWEMPRVSPMSETTSQEKSFQSFY